MEMRTLKFTVVILPNSSIRIAVGDMKEKERERVEFVNLKRDMASAIADLLKNIRNNCTKEFSMIEYHDGSNPMVKFYQGETPVFLSAEGNTTKLLGEQLVELSETFKEVDRNLSRNAQVLAK
jgi:phosphopantothenate synthetase